MTWTKVSLNEAKRCATAKTSSPSTMLVVVGAGAAAVSSLR